MLLMNLCENTIKGWQLAGILITIIKIVVPIIIITTGNITFFKAIKEGTAESLAGSAKILFKKIIAGIIIFMIPTIINNVIVLLSNKEIIAADTKKCSICFESPTSNDCKDLVGKYEDSLKENFETEDESVSGSVDTSKLNDGQINQDNDNGNQSGSGQENNNGNNNNNNNNNGGGNTDHTLETNYGVFLGLDHDDGISKLLKYKLVVIDLQEYKKEDVDKLHAQGIKVYSYLNVGSVEKYRTYYKRFSNLYTGTYENWEDERWVDVSNSSFQNFIINELEPSLRANGADGYFIDNCDVYAENKKEKIYKGLQTILGAIHKHNLPLLINGGDEFVSRAISDGSYSSLFDGVNQEEVFTLINFDNHTYKNQSESEKKYYQNYLQKVKGKNLLVYLLEYGASSSKEKEIAEYCQANGFAYYNSPSYNLD